MDTRIALLCVRLGIALILAGAIALLPDSDVHDFVRWKNALACLCFVAGVGKAFFDTFYEGRHGGEN